MDCERWREVVSADLDREATGEESRAAATHLGGCAPCARWFERAAAVTRRARTRPAEESPDLVADVLRALAHGRPARSEEPVVPDPDPDPDRRLRLLVGGEPVSDCGCAATCGCGCQQGRVCRCGEGHAA